MKSDDGTVPDEGNEKTDVVVAASIVDVVEGSPGEADSNDELFSVPQAVNASPHRKVAPNSLRNRCTKR